nr:MAG TPA: hypothetical protein [Caudoviricetes sp.]
MKVSIVDQLIAYAKYLDAITEDMDIKTAAFKGYIDCLWNNDKISGKDYDSLISGLLK